MREGGKRGGRDAGGGGRGCERGKSICSDSALAVIVHAQITLLIRRAEEASEGRARHTQTERKGTNERECAEGEEK